MDEQKIRQMIRQEIQAAIASSSFSMKNVPQHTHTGTAGDSPKIPASNIVQGNRASGLVTMATDGRVYRIGLNFNASQILFYGTAVHDSGGIDVRANVVGNAQLGSTYTLIDDGTGFSVTTSGQAQSIIQGSSSITIDTSGAAICRAITSGENIAYVVDGGGSQAAVATVIGYGPDFADVQVILDADWYFQGYFVVT